MLGPDREFSPDLISFLTDDIILQRYVELNGRLQKVIAVVKKRGSADSTELRRYEVTKHRLVLGEPPGLVRARDVYLGCLFIWGRSAMYRKIGFAVISEL